MSLDVSSRLKNEVDCCMTLKTSWAFPIKLVCGMSYRRHTSLICAQAEIIEMDDVSKMDGMGGEAATHRDIELEYATDLGRRIGRDIGVLQNLLEAGWEPVRDEFV